MRATKTALLGVIALAVGCSSGGGQNEKPAKEPVASDAAASRAAFLAVYPVFLHPRCVNCHPAGDAPLQGDDSHVHGQNVKRGADGRGRVGLRCSSCHMDANVPGEHMPPGNPSWRLPAPEMPLVFEGRTPRELADQLKDVHRNGGKTLAEIVRHVCEDKLVLGGWKAGDGRAPPPLEHAEFARKLTEWVDKGAVSPE
jgi:hypothetical protein